jgi:hypothetical protein
VRSAVETCLQSAECHRIDAEPRLERVEKQFVVHSVKRWSQVKEDVERHVIAVRRDALAMLLNMTATVE